MKTRRSINTVFYSFLAGLALCSSCVTALPPDTDLRERIVGTWKLEGDSSIAEYRRDGTSVDSNWVPVNGNPENIYVLVLHQARYRVIDHTIFLTNDTVIVVDPPTKPMQIKFVMGTTDIRISGDSLYIAPVSVFTPEKYPAKPLQGRWTSEETIYLGPPKTHPHYFFGKVRTTFDFSLKSHTFKQYTEYPSRPELAAKVDSGSFTYDPPFLWLNDKSLSPIRVEIVESRMYCFRSPYHSRAHRVH